ncbi:Auxin-responsive protein SAUR21 [Bienertia sinuspersici]
MSNAKQILKIQSSVTLNKNNQKPVPKGHIAVYIGDEEKKRHVVPLSLLSNASFQALLRRAEDKFEYHRPMGGLTIPCSEQIFNDLTARLNHH